MNRVALTEALTRTLIWLKTEGWYYVVSGSLPRGASLAQDQTDIYVPMSGPCVTTFLTEAQAWFTPVFQVERRSRGLDYVTLSGEGWSLDVVPVESLTDCSILHGAHFRGRTGSACIQVLEFKTLLKALGIYGADSAVEGFSGFLVELMVDQVGGPRRLDPVTLARFLLGRITDPVDPSRNLERALFRGHIFRLLAYFRGVRTGSGQLLVFRAQQSRQKDFPAARRYLAQVARALPLEMYTHGPYFFVEAPVLHHRVWVRKTVPPEAAERVRRPLFINDQLCCYEERTFDLNKIPGLIRV